MVAHWPLDARSGPVARDATGHGHHGTLSGDARWERDALDFGAGDGGGSSGYVDLPDNLLAGTDAVTVSAGVFLDSDLPPP